jgi:hypothetical protein
MSKGEQDLADALQVYARHWRTMRETQLESLREEQTEIEPKIERLEERVRSRKAADVRAAQWARDRRETEAVVAFTPKKKEPVSWLRKLLQRQ